MSERNSRPVYSTASGSICPKCGWPVRDCKCSSQFARDEPIPARIVAKLRMEKKGRGGKTVTVVFDLPRNDKFLKELCADLKRLCGTGGTVKDYVIEIQGDHRERIVAALEQRGFRVHLDRTDGREWVGVLGEDARALAAELAAHPAVTLAAVIGRRRQGNEEVIAFVQPAPGAGVSEAELAAFLAPRLAP